jgi:predicted TIM-barrel enzyme
MTISNDARRTLRTVLQPIVGIAAATPLILSASGIPDATPGYAVLVAVSAGVCRVMALPSVNALLPSWLSVDQPTGGSGE